MFRSLVGTFLLIGFAILGSEASPVLPLDNALEKRTTYSNSSYSATQEVEYIHFSLESVEYVSHIGEMAILSAPLNVDVPQNTTNAKYSLATVTTNCTVDTDYMAKDDVWTPAFQEMIFVPEKCETKKANVFGMKNLPAPGPYVLYKDRLNPVYRVYEDPQVAFTTGLMPLANGKFAEFAVPVPSRLYFEKKPEGKPLYGVRVAVKDIFDIAGSTTTCGNRAYGKLYGAAVNSSPTIQRMIDLGVQIVGRTTASQFANGEVPTADWVDQFCPFNPRGDGYQDPGNSSSGSGAAIASYPWLDVTVGSDTGGSVRDPAGFNGALGIRPSWGAANLTGVMPLSDLMDTAGYFAREATLFMEFGKAWYDLNKKHKKPTKLFAPSDLWKDARETGGHVKKVFEDFLEAVENYLSVNATSTAFDDIWDQHAGTKEPMEVYVNLTYAMLISKYQWKHVGVPFNQTYFEKYGHVPFLDPSVVSRWSWGLEHSDEDYKREVGRKAHFQEVVSKHMLPGDCSSVVLFPHTLGATSYRNAYKAHAPGPPLGFWSGSIASYAGVPDMSIPLGERTYESTITKNKQKLPLTVSLLGAQGCDLQVLELAKDFEDKGLTHPVKTGSTLF